MREGLPNDFDPLAPETFDSPYDLYARLRRECPVAHTHAWDGVWALSKYDDVRAAAADWKTFITSVQNVVPKVAFTGRRPPLHLDPPEHTPYRLALNPLLNEEKAAPFEAPIRQFCGELLGPLIARSEGDICGEFSSHLPIYVFAEWMRMPPELVEDLRKVGRDYNVAVQSNDVAITKETSLRLYAMARGLIDLRKREPMDPADDPTSALLAARHNGEPLPDELIIGCVRQVLVVGIIAPTVVIGSICVHLSRDQALQQQLRADPSLIPAALEEFLRLYTPYRGFARTASREVEIRGCPIKPGEPIALMYASANRDDDIFPDADRFNMNRPNIKDHLAFGRGPHHCPGAPLARLQLRVALEELLARTARFDLNGPIRPTRFPEIGALEVPLRFTPAPKS
jgi:cytochrome P450